MKLLHIDSSITGAHSVSRELSALVVERLVAAGAQDVTYRDLAADALPHLTAATAPSAHPLAQAAPALDEAQQSQRATSDAILAEFLAADIIVIGVPMYNFTIPSALKAWVDRLIVPGTTFRKGDTGPIGLVGGKRVILAVARGGVYAAGTPLAGLEHAEALLRTLLGFIGVTEIETIVAEGLNLPEVRNTAIASAREAARQLAA
ncbi:FMN-dependent NADH-azoreductase [Sphingomonas morindae]|uniref:FMN dependent NADH:quinone oxidoreductase n=1 Tax=Sphingomonas morindae TaxID=1541170 RepID=A0ABY4X797_9SPHN|nr:NAD(P)H-dependent oxidoreductase [Sphingomonas morindae]USI72803.1 NAD(P)H-dependent oxidoreductase [Sphingomonas morindae]